MRCSDLYDSGADALGHEELSPRWDYQVNCSDKIPRRDRLPCRNSRLLVQAAECERALDGRKDGSLAGRKIVRETRGEEAWLDIRVNIAACQGHEVEDECRISSEAGGR